MKRHLHDFIPLWPIPYLYKAWIGSMRCRKIWKKEHLDAAYPCIATLWHDELFPAPALPGKGQTFMMLASANRDGQIMGNIVKAYDMILVTGSSTRGGAEVLLTVKRGLTEDGYAFGITVDGPKGPRHHAKPGSIWLSVQTGRPIVPVRTFYSKPVTFHSWDKFQLPLPFSAMTTIFGEPWYPKADIESKESMKLACAELDQRMEALTEEYHE